MESISYTHLNVNGGELFSFHDYSRIFACEEGEEEFSPAAEDAYMRLNAAFSLGQPRPEGVPESWWKAQERFWRMGEEMHKPLRGFAFLRRFWNRGR